MYAVYKEEFNIINTFLEAGLVGFVGFGSHACLELPCSLVRMGRVHPEIKILTSEDPSQWVTTPGHPYQTQKRSTIAVLT